ncbi:tripartite-type tricarboxylate transporter receptor subunit TctC [Brevibacterium sanguinis]|uniref:Tripartite-type tricarboxylate transporter receptor subunit TctC n=2 Tax=Brevibacterium TaxID=1696 RepID=A0A366IJD1_9MICO|nr:MULTISPECIES: tripartite tricarboxylate transporter substrate binding protein [Brevibacterium]RBP64986.1 tripartite-type tricarboxylate transporter receptor subunit TctC [Brevibacterium sanguinis]RBP71249.1 tripartite-type tricarboxylate transporter receptor subunit TctC [Brevibacterium celere]
MKIMKRKAAGLLAATSTLAVVLSGCGGNVAAGGGGDAADYPTKEVTVTVGAAAGGSTDLIARAVSEGASAELGQSMPVVNKPGANGALAANEVAAAAPDGYSIATLNASLITITPLAVGEEEAVSIDDFEVITGISQDDYVLVANPDAGVKTLDDVKSSDSTLSFGTTGVGTGSQLAQSLLLAELGIEFTEVPFDSGAPAVTATLGNQVNLSTVQLGEAKPHIDAGKLVPIIVFSKERNKFLDDVPTAAEEGFDIPVSQYRAMVAPKGTPDEVIKKLDDAFKATFATEEYKEFNEQNLLTPHEVSGDEIAEEWSALADQYKKLVDEHKIDLSD